MGKFFVVGMPKSGTTSLSSFFQCGGLRTSHYGCGRTLSCSDCIYKNLSANRSVLHGCDQYDAYTQLDAEPREFCFFPQRSDAAMLAIHETYPNSTLVLNLRPPLHWINSVSNWNDMRKRLGNCDDEFSNAIRSDEAMSRLYVRHTDTIRSFAARYNHRLVEVDIESSDVMPLLNATGISQRCWRHRNSNAHHRSRQTCFVGDSLVRYLWCYFYNVSTCAVHHDLRSRDGRFVWAPLLENILGTSLNGCAVVVWNNLFHQVRRTPYVFHNAGRRAHDLKVVEDHIARYTQRSIHYVSQMPRGGFANETHHNVTMWDAWHVDALIANQSRSTLSVRADLLTDGVVVDGRHYDAHTLERIAHELRPMLETR